VKYALMILVTDESRESIRRDRAAHRARVVRWTAAQFRAGTLISGEAFDTEAEKAATVRRGGGTVEVTDGPFHDGAEELGGYLLVEVADRAAAVELATTWPNPDTIEVRAVRQP